MPTPAFTIRPYADALAHHFRDINVEWIEAMYVLEDADRDVLDNPRTRIIEPGGIIQFIETPDLGIVGTCALRKTGDSQFELTKMGVRETARGLKAGEALLQAMIDKAQEMDVQCLYLLTNRKSEAAIHLYHKLGFVHDDDIMARFGGGYERCNVAMRYRPA